MTVARRWLWIAVVALVIARMPAARMFQGESRPAEKQNWRSDAGRVSNVERGRAIGWLHLFPTTQKYSVEPLVVGGLPAVYKWAIMTRLKAHGTHGID